VSKEQQENSENDRYEVLGGMREGPCRKNRRGDREGVVVQWCSGAVVRFTELYQARPGVGGGVNKG